MRKAVAFFIAFLALGIAGAESIRGKVVEKGSGTPLPLVYVTVPGTELVAETADDGTFALEGLPAGAFALKVISETHATADLKFDSAPATEILIELEALSVEMDAIKVVGQRDTIKTTRTVTEEQIRNTSTGGDPFALVERSPDVVSMTNPALENDVQAARDELTRAMDVPVMKLINPFAFRGLPYYSNAYFMERYLPLFFQYYSLSGIMISSIVPADILGGMEMYGWGRDPSLGPGNGLLSTFDIAEPATAKVNWTVYLSALATGIVLKVPIMGDRGGLSLSLRKSLYEITWIPLVIELNDIYKWFPVPGIGDSVAMDFTIFPGNVDAYLHFFLEPDARNRIALDLFNATGYTTLDFAVLDRSGFFDFSYSDTSMETGGGLMWEARPTPSFLTRIKAYDVLSLQGHADIQKMLGGETSEVSYEYPLNDVGGGVDVEAGLGEAFRIAAGASARNIQAWYLRTRSADPIFGTMGHNDAARDNSLGTWEASGFAKATIDLGGLELEPSVRADYFPLIGSPIWYANLRGSPMLQAYWFFAPGQSLHAGGGMRYDRFDYFTRHTFESERGLRELDANGATVTIDDSYVQKFPSRLFSADADYSLESGPFSLRLGAYYGYVDELSGFDFQTYYAKSDAATADGQTPAGGTTGFKAATALWSLGANLDVGMKWPNASLDFLYNYGMVRFYADREGKGAYEWIVPKSDVTHTVKVFGHWDPNANWSLDGTLKALVGIPAAQHRVTAAATDPASGFTSIIFETIPGTESQFRDYMPRFTFDFKILFRLSHDPALEFYSDIANLISFPRYLQPAVKTVGFEEKTWLDREYDWSPIYWGNLLYMKLDIGCRLKM
jgi:hypothetical protein